MTIRVEREALLRVINTSGSSLNKATTTSLTSLSSKPCNPCIGEEDEYVIVDSVPTKKFYSDLIPGSTGDDDLASVCTLSTSSVSSYDDSSSEASTVERRVTFATDIVTEVWTRERTPLEDVSNLYYSAVETQTFRQEYRLEKKLLSELSIDPETTLVGDDDLSSLIAATTSTSNAGRHRISRVCVVYNDKLETFCNPADFRSNNQGSSQPLTASFGSQNVDCKYNNNNNNKSAPSDFFDNDSFWSGSLTWY
jgi:hypothetical protein